MTKAFVSASCEGEKCYCGEPAEHKVEETIFWDDPNPTRHPLTVYVCHKHFRTMMGAAAGRKGDNKVKKLLPILLLVSTTALAQEKPIGKIISLEGTAMVNSIAAEQGTMVNQGDEVKTGNKSSLGLVFTDGTAFSLSENSTMTLDTYVYDAKGSNNNAFLSLKKGTFNFLAGQVAKTGNMRVDTPVGTMGIRGTAPHVEIAEDGTTKFSTMVESNKKVKPK